MGFSIWRNRRYGKPTRDNRMRVTAAYIILILVAMRKTADRIR